MAQAPRFQSMQLPDPLQMLQSISGLQRFQEHDQITRDQQRQQQLLAEVAQEAPDDPDAWIGLLNERGAPELALKLRTSLTEERTKQAKLTETQLGNTLKRFERASAIAAGITDDASFQRGRMLIADALGPDLAQHLGEVYDPAVIEEARQWGTTETGRLTAQRDAVNAYQEALKLEAADKQNAPETLQKWMEATGTLLSAARNPEEWAQMVGLARQSGTPAAILQAMPQEFTPDAPQLAAQLAMTPEQREQAEARAGTLAETTRHNRAMEGRPTGATAPVSVIGPDGKPVYVRPEQAYGMAPASNREQGRPVTSGDAARFAELRTSLDDLDMLNATLIGTPENPIPAGATGTDAKIGASLPNWVTNLTGWGEDAKKRQAVIDRVKQVIGKALEGGVLRKEDEVKYEKILPTIGDPPEVARTKLEGLAQAIRLRLDRELEARADAGYDTSAFLSRQTSAGGNAAPASSGNPFR